jgi:glycyl-tRNA synthetase
VAVELTYGLERILIALNNAKAIWDEEWAPGVTYGEVRRHEEYEHSKYYFEVADVARVRQMYESYLAEAEACLAQGLVVPAHDYVLKSSHVFNTLDCRGAIGVTERQACFRQMRELARRVALAYLDQRQALEYPLLKETGDGGRKTEAKPALATVLGPSPFLLEIGVEELPSGDVDAVLEQLRARVPGWLDELRLAHGDVRIFATPRRVTVAIAALAPRQEDREDLVKGPPADRAFDKDGNPTPAAIGFAKGKGLDVSDLQVLEIDGGKYVGAVVKQAGRSAPEVLFEALPAFVAAISFTKTMRWRPGDPTTFSRPIRWLVALLGETVIPFEYAGLTAGNVSRGLRPYDSPELPVASAEKYFDVVRAAGIVLDSEERSKLIVEQVKAAAKQAGGEAIIEDGLLAEVTNLVEMPTAILGGFNPDFLQLPRDVLVSVMKKHQRYFPVEQNGKLLANFIAVRNGDAQYLDIVREGNEHVLGARFADANFFVREDVKKPLEAYRAGLKTLTFQTKLGSMLDKSERMLKLSAEIADMLGLDAATREHVTRATFLAKADLTTRMVTEMTSLQGIIGREYALRSGEDPAVAAAIGGQYQPVPQGKAGVALALTDRIDALVGLFAAGLAPTGAKDPFALRRAAIGTVQPLLEHDLDFDLRAAIEKAAALQPIEVTDEVKQQVLDFLAGRLSVLLKDAGHRYDIVDAVLAAQSNNPAGALRAVKQLGEWVKRGDWNTLLPAYARCVRIIRSAQSADRGPWTVDEGKLVDASEKALYQTIHSTVHGQPSTVDEFLGIVVQLVPAIDKFFDDVLVMDKDDAVRRNRLALVGQIANLSQGLADLGKLEGF